MNDLAHPLAVAATSLVYRPMLVVAVLAPTRAPLARRRHHASGTDAARSPAPIAWPARPGPRAARLGPDTVSVSVERMGLSVIFRLLSLSHPFRHSRYDYPGLLGDVDVANIDGLVFHGVSVEGFNQLILQSEQSVGVAAIYRDIFLARWRLAKLQHSSPEKARDDRLGGHEGLQLVCSFDGGYAR